MRPLAFRFARFALLPPFYVAYAALATALPLLFAVVRVGRPAAPTPRRLIVWVGATLVVGVGIGWLYERTGSLLSPIVCHYAFNLLA